MTKRSLPFRTHYFSLAVCKHIFLHPTHGPVFVRNAMRCHEAGRYGLSPLLLYALFIPGTAIRRMTFALREEPHALYTTLHHLWAQEAEGFRGRPDALMLSRQVAAASPTLANRLALDGVELIIADKGDKVLGTALRTAQQDAMWFGLRPNSRQINTLGRLDEEAAARHHSDLKIPAGEDLQHQERWAALPCRPAAAQAGADEMDWSPGQWLASWEENLPLVSQSRYFHYADDDQTMWPLIGSGGHSFEDDSGKDDESAADLGWKGADDPTIVTMAKDMVTCWPNSVAEVARSIGTTTRDLNWFLGSKAAIDERALSELLSVLGIESLKRGYPEASGPCVLIAKKVGAAARLYNELSHGGNLTFSYEAVPESGQPDPSWRYLLFQSCGEPPSIMMFERGSTAVDHLNEKTFINFEGMRQVPAMLYRDVVATCARACHNPLANRREVLGFAKRQAAVLY